MAVYRKRSGNGNVSPRWYGTLKTYDGKRKQVPLALEKTTSERLLRRLQCDEDEKRANGANTFSVYRRRPLTEFVNEYRHHLEAKGNTCRHVGQTIRYTSSILAVIKATVIEDVDPGRITKTLHRWRVDGRHGIGTSNHYLVAVKGFTRWLWEQRYTSSDPLCGLRRMNVDVDRRRIRRPLTPDELKRLTQVTHISPKTFRGKGWRLTPADRVMIYTVAAYTGLRLNEVATLERSAIDVERMTLTIDAVNAKNRKRTTLPLVPSLCEKLESYMKESASSTSTRLFPGGWAAHRRGGKIFARDAKAAGIVLVDPHDHRTRVDFHSLRVTFITSLALAGVHPSKAQRLARHSDINLTMNVYTSLSVDDLRDAVGSLTL